MLNSSVVRLARSQLTTRPEREFIDEISLICNSTAKLNFNGFESIYIRIDFAMIEIYVYCIVHHQLIFRVYSILSTLLSGIVTSSASRCLDPSPISHAVWIYYIHTYVHTVYPLSRLWSKSHSMSHRCNFHSILIHQ